MAPEDFIPGPEDGEDSTGTYEYVEEIVEYRDTRWLRGALIAILIILLLLLAGIAYLLWSNSRVAGGTTGAADDKMKWVRSIYGWGSAQDQQLIAPTAVATAPDGIIWTNSSNRIAVGFNPDGTFDRLLRGSLPTTDTDSGADSSSVSPNAPTTPGANGVVAVFSLDVDGDNNLFIGDDASENILKFTPEARLLKGWSVPGAVKAAANDTHVAVIGKGRLGVFNQETGAPVFDFGTRGQGANQFDLPVGVHIDDAGFVYVADTQNQRVRKYTPSGRLEWDAGTVPERKFESHVQAPKGIFQLPTGVTTDANGRVVVIDAFNYSITVLEGDTGKKIASYGEYGQADGQFDNPSAITYDAERDYFVVADSGNNRLQVVRIPGSASLDPGPIIRRAFRSPLWILCLPFIILLIAMLITAMIKRRNSQDAAAAGVDGTEQAVVD